VRFCKFGIQIQCHVVKNILLQTAFLAIFPTGLTYFSTSAGGSTVSLASVGQNADESTKALRSMSSFSSSAF